MGASIDAGGSRRRSSRRALAEINVTPLVDVMLVLLVISMLAAPMLERGVPLELPATETATDIDDQAEMIVSIDREGRIRLNERPVHLDLLVDRMSALARTRPGDTVYLRADRLIPYGEVLRIMDRIRKAGVRRVALVTVPLSEEDAGKQ